MGFHAWPYICEYVIMHIVVYTHRSLTQRVLDLSLNQNDVIHSYSAEPGKDGLVGKTPLFLLSSREGGVVPGLVL